MESILNFRIVGNYSIQQTNWICSEKRPREDCHICKNAKYATILIREGEFNDDFVCAECLLEIKDSLKGKVVIDKKQVKGLEDFIINLDEKAVDKGQDCATTKQISNGIKKHLGVSDE